MAPTKANVVFTPETGEGIEILATPRGNLSFKVLPNVARALTDANTPVSYQYSEATLYSVTARFEILTEADYLQLLRFWRTTCRGAAKKFDYLHCDGMELLDCRFSDREIPIERAGPEMFDLAVSFLTYDRPGELLIEEGV
jgi:hypothetical protein